MEVAVFAGAAAAALVGGVALVLARNAVHAALFLVTTQIALAVLFLVQGAFFLAALQVIVYAGAIMVLFVFVLMLLGVDRQEAMIEPLPLQRPIALVLGLGFAALALYLGASEGLRFPPNTGAVPAAGTGNVEAVAEALFTEWAFPFEVTSVLLVVAILGVMSLARRKRS